MQPLWSWGLLRVKEMKDTNLVTRKINKRTGLRNTDVDLRSKNQRNRNWKEIVRIELVVTFYQSISACKFIRSTPEGREIIGKITMKRQRVAILQRWESCNARSILIKLLNLLWICYGNAQDEFWSEILSVMKQWTNFPSKWLNQITPLNVSGKRETNNAQCLAPMKVKISYPDIRQNHFLWWFRNE